MERLATAAVLALLALAAADGAGAAPDPPSSGPPTPICDSARSALERNSPAAPGLVATCRSLGGILALPGAPRDDAAGRYPGSVEHVREQLLAAHNVQRAAVGETPLAWDPELAAAATAYAANLASLGRLAHAPPAARPGQGENLWTGSPGVYSIAQMAAAWTGERAMFQPGVFPSVSLSGDYADVGHYTQIIWPETVHVGCGLLRTRQADYLVCRYAPAGNIFGRQVPALDR